MKIIKFIFSLAVASLCLSGPVHAEVVDKIVAIVNDRIITMVEIQKETAPYLKRIRSSDYSIEKQNQLIKKLNEDVLNVLIEQSLTQQEAKRYQISVSDAEIDQTIENIKKTKSFTQQEFEEALSREGMKLSDYRDTLKKQMVQSQIINAAVKSKVVITESDIKKYYKANAQKYAGLQKHYLKNIVMDDRDQLALVRKKLDENQPFETLAKQFSMASNAYEGGDLGLFDISRFSNEIKDRIAKLKKGEYTDIVATAQGFQIFYLHDIVMDGGIPYDQVSGEIRQILYQEQIEKSFKAWLATLKKNAHIKKML